MQYAPAWPLGIFNTPPIANNSNEVDQLSFLPPVNLARIQARTGFLLGGIHYTRLGHYGLFSAVHKNKQASHALKKFKDDLKHAQSAIEKRNIARVQAWGEDHKGEYFAYTQFLPELIPQSINI